jgi:hypothetical protein
LTPSGLAGLADDIEARAWVDYFDAAPIAVRSALGLSHRRIADTTLLFAPGVAMPLFNRAIGLGCTAPATTEDASRIASEFKSAGVQSWWLHANPYASPDGFASMLESGGWRPAALSHWAKMLRVAGNVEPGASTLRLEAATDSSIVGIVDAIAGGFGMPALFACWIRALHGRRRWQLFGVFDGALPVGGGALFLDGPHAWLGIGSVLESHRRRGGQRALMAARLNAAAWGDARWVATETGVPTEGVNPSLLNMQHLHFHQVAARLNLLPPAA